MPEGTVRPWDTPRGFGLEGTQEAPLQAHSVLLNLESMVRHAAAADIALKSTGIPEMSRAEAQLLIQQLTAIAQTAEAAARQIAVRAIHQNDISRVSAAHMMGVHQATVARWVKESSNTDLQPDTGPQAINVEPL